MIPALLTSTSTLPNSLTASSIMLTMCSLLVMSPTKGTTSPPWRAAYSARSSSRFRPIATASTRAPSRENKSQMALPMLELAPVTTTTLFFKLISLLPYLSKSHLVLMDCVML